MEQPDARHWRELADAITNYIMWDRSKETMAELLWYFWEDIKTKFSEELVSRGLEDSLEERWNNSEEWRRFVEHYFNHLFRVDRIKFGWDEIFFRKRDRNKN